MKITFVLLIVGIIQASASTYAQNVSLNVKNASLADVFTVLHKESGYNFLYDADLLAKTNKVTISIKKVPLTEALNICLKNQPVTYVITDKNVVIRKEPEPVITVLAQKAPQTVKGIVTDEKGQPLPGVTIRVKGMNSATVSGTDGSFSIAVPDNNVLLVFSFVGYTTLEMPVKGDGPMAVKMMPQVSSISEVVVVGYGTQKKINISGSVASVSGNTLAKSPAPTLNNLLEGQIAGLTVVQATGEPGNAGSLQVRGRGSYGASSSPLVLVDGVEAGLSNLNPADIESVSVLKDAASASIYGSRAANGVILVTTKKGKKGESTIELNQNVGTTRATVLPKLITNSVQYMEMFNAATARAGHPAIYTQAQIDAYKNNAGSPQYPNTDWLKYYFHDGPLSSTNVSMSGGNDISDYRVSVGYQNQKGIIKIYDYDRYNALLDYNTKVKKWIKVGTNLNMSYENVLAPTFTNDDLILLMYAQAPTFSPYLLDGSGRRANRDYATNGNVNRTADEVFNMGAQYTKYYNAIGQGYVDISIIKGLSWRTTGAFTFFNQDYRNRSYPTEDPSYAFQPDASGNYVTTGNGNPPFTGLKESWARNLTLKLNSILNYATDFGTDHHVTALAGYEQISNKNTSIGGERYNFISNSINELNGGPTTGWTNSGDASEYALQSVFGRANYNYQGKYFLEGDIRYDGTSRVDPKYRWGTFGGASAAWRVSEEKFIKDNVSWLDDLKLRASYGVLGNQEIGNYPYQDVFANRQYPFNGSLSPAVLVTDLHVKNLRWEKTATTDFGVDMNIFKGLLGVTFDWYKKNTTDILAQQLDVPSSLGLNPPTINAGAMVNKGIELVLTHQNHIGKFTYGLNFLIAANNNKVTKVLAATKGVFDVGLPYNSYYIYQMNGIFQSQDEINNSPAQPNSGNLKPGDIKIKDVNGDGKITPDDRVSFSPFPNYTYSFGANAGWNGFNLSAFFQGVQGQKFIVNGWGIDPFFQGTAPTTDFLNAWTPQNHSNTIPAVYQNGYAGVSGYQSTYYLKDASYLRLKNINLSYTFSSKLIKAEWLKQLTIYVAGSNLFTWTKYPGADPERSGSGRYAQFPQTKIFSGGLKVSL